MRSIFKKISNNLDLTFFYLFILSIPLGTKLVFLSKDSYFTDAFVHYTTFFLYLSDIFFILALFFWILRQIRRRHLRMSPSNYEIHKCHPEFISGSKKLAINYIDRFRNKFGMTIFRRRHSGMSPSRSFLKNQNPHSPFYERGNKSLPLFKGGLRGIYLLVQYLKISPKQNIIYYFLFFFLICAVLSIFSAKNNLVGIYQVLKLFEFILLFILAGKLINSLKKLCFCFILILSTGFTQAVISVAQYYKQSSLGLKWLGEPILSPDLAGVAKIVVDGEKIIRAYGTFPHPNILAGFLLISLFISFYFLLFYTNIRRRHIDVSPSVSFYDKKKLNRASILLLTKEELEEVKQKEKPTSPNLSFVRRGITPPDLLFARGKTVQSIFKSINSNFFKITQNWRFLLLIILISIQFLAFILTFSRTAWLAGLFSLFCFIIIHKIVSRETIANFGLIKRKFASLIIIILIISCFSVMLLPQISTRFEINKNDQAISDRFLFNSFAFDMIKKSLFLGIGMGNFVLNIDNNSLPLNKGEIKGGYVLEPWQYQPVHNFYLLIAAEIGIIGLILFIFFIFKVLKMAYLKAKSQIVSRETIYVRHINLCAKCLLLIFLGFLFIGFFDHYFWTIQQGQLTFWLILGLLVVSCKVNETC